MAFQVRIATARDMAGIARVQVASWRTTYRGIVPTEFLAAMDVAVRERAWQEQYAKGETWMFVAEDASGVVGFVSGGALREAMPGYDAELYAIYLLKDCQAKGAGRAMLVALARALREAGFGGMVVWALADNPAVGFYKRMGAHAIAGKMITISGARLPDLALGWTSLDGLVFAGKK